MSLQEKQVQAQGLQRCPFCHESIDVVEAEAWVCCQQCLARHHTGCWEEGGACSSCNHHAALSPQTAPAEVGQTVGPVVNDELDAVRLETAHALQSAKAGGHWFTSLATGVISCGVWPILKAENALRVHRADNRRKAGELPHVPEAIRADLQRAHREAYLFSPGGSLLRVGIPAIMMLISTIAFFALIASAIDHSHHYMNHVLDALIAQGFMVLGFLGYLHAFRESVARHETRQSYTTLVSDAVPHDTSREHMDRVSSTWTRRRVGDVSLTLLCCVPVLGVLLFPLVASRLSGHLARHEVNELDLEKTRERAAFSREVEKA